ncbi:RNase H [Phytophthora megakarya]|uniref:RNase H n=1 Tax=Phytophthora megakarya TaxID=4795 RepID=A0A225VPQ3_9STRA|nr:RNase H [Phytophthora megakarya]
MVYGDLSTLSDNEDMEEVEEEVDLDWYCAVAIGRCRGIFTSAKDAMQHTRGYKNSMLKKFPTFEEASEFLTQFGLQVDESFQLFDGSRLYCRGTSQTPYTPLHLLPSVGSALYNGEEDCEAAFACIFPHNRT